MSSIPNVEDWKWFHFLYAIGVPICVGAFFLEQTPLIGELFWIPFGFGLAAFGGFGQAASKRRPFRRNGMRGYEAYLQFNPISVSMLCVSLIGFSISAYAFTEHFKVG
ncbi:hypothetical protein [Motilimonas eburnea]|uniref:hypothetical protein n=1 Tax=Motilimonas eburnea TaxID=1737488 RepID=UPI001E2DAB73|nr:hypothetical protein [Motilimonas eburnea]MCE2571825.1 hypothetical protein [Motilimonas eburnea]